MTPGPRDGSSSASQSESNGTGQQALCGAAATSGSAPVEPTADKRNIGDSGETNLTTERALFEAMDRQAARFIDMLGQESVDLQTQMKVFEMGQNWLIRRQKLKPKDDEEGSGVSDLRAWIEDSKNVELFDQMMFDRGFVKLPPSRPGRPTREEQPVHDRHKKYREMMKHNANDADDSGFQKMLKGGEA